MNNTEENKLKFYIRNDEDSSWKEFDFYDEEKNLPLLKELIEEKSEKGESWLSFYIGDASVFEEYSIAPPHLDVYICKYGGKLVIFYDDIFNRARRIIKFYNHFGKDMLSFIQLLNFINSGEFDRFDDSEFDDFINGLTD